MVVKVDPLATISRVADVTGLVLTFFVHIVMYVPVLTQRTVRFTIKCTEGHSYPVNGHDTLATGSNLRKNNYVY